MVKISPGAGPPHHPGPYCVGIRKLRRRPSALGLAPGYLPQANAIYALLTKHTLKAPTGHCPAANNPIPGTIPWSWVGPGHPPALRGPVAERDAVRPSHGFARH